MCAARLANLNRGANQHTAIAVTSQAQASTLLNVSPRSIQHAASVQRSGIPARAAVLHCPRWPEVVLTPRVCGH